MLSTPNRSFYTDHIYSNEGFPELIDLINDHEQLVLDIGCGAGANARLMKKRGKIVHSITLSEAEARIARPHVDRVLVGDIETMDLNYPEESFDAILLSHILEHLIDPWKTLRRLQTYIRPGGRIYVALPNILFYQERLKFLIGRFQYSNSGIIDRHHLRFFTYETAQELVRESGYRIVLTKAVGSFPLWPLRRFIRKATWIDKTACSLFPNLFGYHIIVVGEKASKSALKN